MSFLVEEALENAVTALIKIDHELAYAIILEDNCINRGFEEINQLCYGFVARHLPSAGHLRMISSILRMNIEMERIGDYEVFAKETEEMFNLVLDRIQDESEKLFPMVREVTGERELLVA